MASHEGPTQAFVGRMVPIWLPARKSMTSLRSHGRGVCGVSPFLYLMYGLLLIFPHCRGALPEVTIWLEWELRDRS